MTCECYFHQCEKHSYHYDPDNGPFCDHPICVATPEQITEYSALREQWLQEFVYKTIPIKAVGTT